MLADRDHLRREDAGGAVEGREGLVEHRHVAADGAGALDEVDLLAGVGDLERGLDAGDAAADDQRGGVHRRGVGHGRKPVGHAVDGAREHGLGALGADAVRGAVLAERGQPHLAGIAAGARPSPVVNAGLKKPGESPAMTTLSSSWARISAASVSMSKAGMVPRSFTISTLGRLPA